MTPMLENDSIDRYRKEHAEFVRGLEDTIHSSYTIGVNRFIAEGTPLLSELTGAILTVAQQYPDEVMIGGYQLSFLDPIEQKAFINTIGLTEKAKFVDLFQHWFNNRLSVETEARKAIEQTSAFHMIDWLIAFEANRSFKPFDWSTVSSDITQWITGQQGLNNQIGQILLETIQYSTVEQFLSETFTNPRMFRSPNSGFIM